MLIAKGYRVSFTNERDYDPEIEKDDRRNQKVSYRCPTTSALLHDETGRDWKADSGLIAGFRRERLEIEDDRAFKDAYKYFNYDPMGGKVVLPPKTISGNWKLVADDVIYIRYVRRGNKEADMVGRMEHSAPSDDDDAKRKMWELYEHTFSRPVKLYRRGAIMRVDLGPGAKWDWRGISKP